MVERGERTARPEHRWPVVVAILIALALYTFLPSNLFAIQRYVVVGIGLVLLIPLIVLNPRRYTKETRFSRLSEVALALIILVANQLTLVLLIVQLVHKSNEGGSLLLASLQVWVTNVIAFALLYWCIDRGGPVARTTVKRAELKRADFRFPQDEDHDNVVEVRAGSSIDSDWVPAFVDYLYFSLTNSMAFSPTDTMPLSTRAKALMALESFAGFVMLALVIARAVAQIG
ncbi:DUF1345 domain-containing protein [Planctomonas sp. JC2975]|uniref:DUF1345 domain-containing protein n=1 Tax=Planctomonas sp. JC2975 TaxID=2729626 RepID=UPI001473528B|nr:DUF1345 domain-containing protein [Planctomonas sp. JC2975]NNC10852.1 DUF1345 domain-containing protein [Planctomonas sp. JC2975]